MAFLSGIFGRKPQPQDGTMPMDLSALPTFQPATDPLIRGGDLAPIDTSMPTAKVNWNDVGKPQATAKPGYDDIGGAHDKINGIAASLMMMGGNADGAKLLMAPMLDRSKQLNEYSRQLALAQFKADNHPSEPGSIEKNFNFINSRNPEYAQNYLRAESNPMALMTDPATGAVGFYPKGGPSMGAAPTAPQIGAVQDGYRFNGGDPSQRTSWSKI